MNRRSFFAALAGLPVATLALSAATKAAPRADGGPIAARKPYIVGERGPESLMTINEIRVLNGLPPIR